MLGETQASDSRLNTMWGMFKRLQIVPPGWVTHGSSKPRHSRPLNSNSLIFIFIGLNYRTYCPVSSNLWSLCINWIRSFGTCGFISLILSEVQIHPFYLYWTSVKLRHKTQGDHWPLNHFYLLQFYLVHHYLIYETLRFYYFYLLFV
jgi:hypothetical protein